MPISKYNTTACTDESNVLLKAKLQPKNQNSVHEIRKMNNKSVHTKGQRTTTKQLQLDDKVGASTAQATADDAAATPSSGNGDVNLHTQHNDPKVAQIIDYLQLGELQPAT